MTSIQIPHSLTPEAVVTLRAEIAAAAECRGEVLVLTGSAATFCLGLDFDLLSESGGDAREACSAFAECLEALARHPAPVVAFVRGDAAGGGVGLAAVADLVLASERATFSCTELLFGLLPAIVTPVLLTRLTAARLRLWALAASRWDAETACRYGLADVVTPHAHADAELARWVRRLGRADPDMVAELKALLIDDQGGTPHSGARLTAERLADPVVRSGIRAFVQEGTAPWLIRRP